jgi:hypothetical protein
MGDETIGKRAGNVKFWFGFFWKAKRPRRIPDRQPLRLKRMKYVNHRARHGGRIFFGRKRGDFHRCRSAAATLYRAICRTCGSDRGFPKPGGACGALRRNLRCDDREKILSQIVYNCGEWEHDEHACGIIFSAGKPKQQQQKGNIMATKKAKAKKPAKKAAPKKKAAAKKKK